MAALQRWKMVDPTDTDPATREYTFWPSPNKMSSPFPARALTVSSSSAPGGQPLVWEGPRPTVEWSFGGSILNAAQYEALRSWVYERDGHIWVYDHFGRRHDAVLKEFNPEAPERMKNGRYWYHTYTIKATVFSTSAPTVDENGMSL